MIGTQLAHFRISAKLGEGGMGEVYRAEDTKLGRDVALKLLPREMAADGDRLRRFTREARTVAALNHPNIVTIFSVEQDGDLHFLTMELVEGETLDTRVSAEGLDLEPLFELAIPIADAVAAAHDRGIVHRDLKPGNVMVTADGRVKVLDFGLAKLSESTLEQTEPEMETRTTPVTLAGAVLGTPHYMSPEQARGDQLDQRSDIFSLGVMLYEMATGRRPFEGESTIEVLSSVLKDRAPIVTEIRPGLPRHLGRMIDRCLEKAPIDRYQTARDVFNELRALRKETVSGVAPGPSSDSVLRRSQPEAPWIAVLPFTCRTADPDLESFADGLTEDITTGLSRFSYLLVVSRNSTRKLEGQSFDVRRVGRELGARYVIEGSLRKGGSTVRVSVQLLDARTGTHLWAETFDRNLDAADVFELQDDITDRVVATTADPFGVLARSMAAPTASKPPESLSPYEAVLRYFVYQQRISAEDHLPTRTAVERAVELEPGYADAWACLATLLLDEDRHSFNTRPDALDRALAAARRAVDADPANPFANFSLAQTYYYRGDLGAFRSAAERAIGLNRRDGNTMAMAGILMGYAGDWERAVELTTTAMELNPHHPGWYRFTAFFNEYRQQRYAEALAIAQTINLPDYFPTHYATAIAHAQLGNLEAAKVAADELRRLWPEFEGKILVEHLEKWYFPQPDLIEHVIEGLEKAGIRVRRPGREADADEPTAD